MKPICSALLASLFCLLLAGRSIAADDPRIAALEAADDGRIAAVKAGDEAALARILSDDLHYGHSSGPVDTKAAFIESLTSGRVRYAVYDNEQRNFTLAAPNIALMSGRAHVKVETATGGMDSQVGYLGVWRDEAGTWRFLAWQACRILPKKP